MNIDHLGAATIEQLIDRGLVRGVADLYRLTSRRLRGLQGFGDKSADNLIRAIAAPRTRGVSRVLNALGIRLVGEHVAQLLAARFGSLDELAKASVDELAAIRGVGPTIAESIGQFFADAGNRRMLQRLAAAGVRVVEPKTAPSPGLAGKSFVLTGTLNEVTRSEAVDLVERSERGYRVRVAEDGLLVVGKQPGQKLETARRLGIPTMGEREFLAMLRSRAA